ncbi:hypothetical protein DID88_007622 [Monilinia fructigena]|uniref:Uncharacterized protein n=1 Tax=Monilinia fructigena TaxID=38457 RepID=A0A395J808_9HELO|nr:hypothetical protein DID88_007622 [Monilinia fructigena]
MSMITATAWVPRGFAAPFPTKYNFDEEEFQRIADLAKLQLDDANEDLEEAQNTADNGANPDAMVDDDGSDDEAVSKGVKSKAEEDDDLKEYDLDHYDDDVEEDKEEDPYITMAANAEDEDEEREELQILATDNMLLAAKIEDEVAHLEVYVYEDSADNLYVHHDIMLPAIPLCVEWLDLPVGKPSVDKDSRANFVAVGTFDPDIEIWDLDTVDCMYPNAILGQAGQNKGGDEGAKKRRRTRNKTVKLWDLNTTTCAKSYTHHTDKVCSLAWHPKESTVLLSGSYDRTVVAADMRAPDAKAPRWGVESDVENVRWDPHDPNYFYVSTESGVIHFHDVRKAPANPSATKPVWMLQAHDESVSSFDINPTIPGFLATGSGDKQVKLWNIQPTGPTMVVTRDLDVGKVFSTTFAPDEEVSFRLAVAGSKGVVQVWDCSTNPGVRRAFADRVAPISGEIKERLVGVQNDSESEDEDEELEDADGAEFESMDEDD